MDDMFRINTLKVEGLPHLRDSYRAYVDEVGKKEKPSQNQEAYCKFYASFLPYWENPELSSVEKLSILEAISTFYSQARNDCQRFVDEYGRNPYVLYMIDFGTAVIDLIEKEKTLLPRENAQEE